MALVRHGKWRPSWHRPTPSSRARWAFAMSGSPAEWTLRRQARPCVPAVALVGQQSHWLLALPIRRKSTCRTFSRMLSACASDYDSCCPSRNPRGAGTLSPICTDKAADTTTGARPVRMEDRDNCHSVQLPNSIRVVGHQLRQFWRHLRAVSAGSHCVCGSYSPQILHHPDRHAISLNQADYLASEDLIAIHMRGRDKEIRVAPIARELQTPIGFVFKRDLLPANRDA